MFVAQGVTLTGHSSVSSVDFIETVHIIQQTPTWTTFDKKILTPTVSGALAAHGCPQTRYDTLKSLTKHLVLVATYYGKKIDLW